MINLDLVIIRVVSHEFAAKAVRRFHGEESEMAEAPSSQVVYTSRVRIERQVGPLRLAYLPAEKDPVVFGVHSEVAEHYKVSPGACPPRATTLDYVVAAAGG